jgi:hypothetical protein
LLQRDHRGSWCFALCPQFIRQNANKPFPVVTVKIFTA